MTKEEIMYRHLAEKMIDKNQNRETIIVDCNAQYGRCEVVNNLRVEITALKKKLEKIKIICEPNWNDPGAAVLQENIIGIIDRNENV